jgi:hypothetical protein
VISLTKPLLSVLALVLSLSAPRPPRPSPRPPSCSLHPHSPHPRPRPLQPRPRSMHPRPRSPCPRSRSLRPRSCSLHLHLRSCCSRPRSRCPRPRLRFRCLRSRLRDRCPRLRLRSHCSRPAVRACVRALTVRARIRALALRTTPALSLSTPTPSLSASAFCALALALRTGPRVLVVRALHAPLAVSRVPLCVWCAHRPSPPPRPSTARLRYAPAPHAPPGLQRSPARLASGLHPACIRPCIPGVDPRARRAVRSPCLASGTHTTCRFRRTRPLRTRALPMPHTCPLTCNCSLPNLRQPRIRRAHGAHDRQATRRAFATSPRTLAVSCALRPLHAARTTRRFRRPALVRRLRPSVARRNALIHRPLFWASPPHALQFPNAHLRLPRTWPVSGAHAPSDSVLHVRPVALCARRAVASPRTESGAPTTR